MYPQACKYPSRALTASLDEWHRRISAVPISWPVTAVGTWLAWGFPYATRARDDRVGRAGADIVVQHACEPRPALSRILGYDFRTDCGTCSPSTSFAACFYLPPASLGT